MVVYEFRREKAKTKADLKSFSDLFNTFKLLVVNQIELNMSQFNVGSVDGDSTNEINNDDNNNDNNDSNNNRNKNKNNIGGNTTTTTNNNNTPTHMKRLSLIMSEGLQSQLDKFQLIENNENHEKHLTSRKSQRVIYILLRHLFYLRNL